MRATAPRPALLAATLACALAGCASAPARRAAPASAPAAGAREAAAAAPAGEASLLADMEDRRLDAHSFLDAALVVGGAGTAKDLERARVLARRTLGPLEAHARGGDPAKAGRALLRALHEGAPGADGPLRTYDARATTVQEALERGRYNCVSATLLYLVAGREAGLDVRPVLLPSHARAEVLVGGRAVVVETTSPHGFDATAETSREVARRSRGRSDPNAVDLYADVRGTTVDDLALLGVVYMNLSVLARERDDLPASEAYEARADLFVEPSARPLLRRVRASTLQELALRRLDEGRPAEALELLWRAVELAPAGEDARQAEHNLGVAAQRRLDEVARQGDEAATLAFVERFQGRPAVHAELRAQAWNRIALARAGRGDSAGASEAARQAALAGRGTENDDVYSHNLAAAELNRLQDVADTDPERAWTEWQALRVPASLAQTRRDIGGSLAARRLQRALDAGRCADVDARAAEWLALAPGAPAAHVRAVCRNNEGVARSAAGDWRGAAGKFREADRLEPGQIIYRNNLSGALQHVVADLVAQGKCAEAAAPLAEGLRLAPREPVFVRARERCAGGR